MGDYLNNFITSIHGFFSDIFPAFFEIIYEYCYAFLFPLLFATTAYFVVLLIRRIRGD